MELVNCFYFMTMLMIMIKWKKGLHKLHTLKNTLESNNQSLTARVIINITIKSCLWWVVYKNEKRIFLWICLSSVSFLLNIVVGKNWPFHYVCLNYIFCVHLRKEWQEGREMGEQENKSFVWGITMSDKLDFMSERVPPSYLASFHRHHSCWKSSFSFTYKSCVLYP